MSFVTNYLNNLISLSLGKEPIRPLLFSYYITHRCSLACQYCSDGEGKPFSDDKINELSTHDAKRLIRILADASDTLDITGGEPLLRQDLEELLATAKECGMRTVLNTKGIGLIERPLVLKYTDVLVLSVDALEVDQLSKIIGRPRRLASEILRTLDFLLKHHTGRIVLAAVATPDNIDSLDTVMKTAFKYGFGFQISPQIVGTLPHPRLRDNKAYAKLTRAVLDAKRAGQNVAGITPYLEGVMDFRAFRCHPLLMPTIRPDGWLYYPCLERKSATVNCLDWPSYRATLAKARATHGEVPRCGSECQIFCHMALSLLQRHPLAAAAELSAWMKRPITMTDHNTCVLPAETK